MEEWFNSWNVSLLLTSAKNQVRGMRTHLSICVVIVVEKGRHYEYSPYWWCSVGLHARVLMSISIKVSPLYWQIIWDNVLPLPSKIVRISPLGWLTNRINVFFLRAIPCFVTERLDDFSYQALSVLLQKPLVIVGEPSKF